MRHNILRYHPVSESGFSIPMVQLGFRPRHFWAKVCSAFRNTASLASASTTESPQYLMTVFDGTGAAGPEPVHARRLLPRLGNEAGIDAYCNTMSHHWRKEVAVERKPVKGLLEVLAEPALTRAATPRHLGKDHASGGCKIKFHGLDDECSERFASICHA